MLSFWLIQGMEQNFGRGKLLPNDGMVGKVVEVPVRQPQPDDVPPPFGSLLEQRSGRVIRRVKNHGLPGGFIRNQEAISHRHAARVRQ